MHLNINNFNRTGLQTDHTYSHSSTPEEGNNPSWAQTATSHVSSHPFSQLGHSPSSSLTTGESPGLQELNTWAGTQGAREKQTLSSTQNTSPNFTKSILLFVLIQNFIVEDNPTAKYSNYFPKKHMHNNSSRNCSVNPVLFSYPCY